MEGGRKERLLKLAATVPKPIIKIRKVCVVDLLETTMPLIPKKRQRCHSKSVTATHATQIKTHAETFGEMLVLS